MQCQQQNIESMRSEEVEYLDYRRPKERRQAPEYERDPEMQAIAKRLHNKEEPEPQIETPTKPTFTLSLNLKLQKHSVIARVGSYTDAQCDAIILPYGSGAFEYYPCSEIKQELKADSEKIESLSSKPGEIYMRSKKLFNYKFRAFVKVDPETAINDITYGLNSLFKLIQQNPQKLQIHSIAILFTDSLASLQSTLDMLLSLTVALPAPLSLHLLLPTPDHLSQLFKLVS